MCLSKTLGYTSKSLPIMVKDGILDNPSSVNLSLAWTKLTPNSSNLEAIFFVEKTCECNY